MLLLVLGRKIRSSSSTGKIPEHNLGTVLVGSSEKIFVDSFITPTLTITTLTFKNQRILQRINFHTSPGTSLNKIIYNFRILCLKACKT